MGCHLLFRRRAAPNSRPRRRRGRQVRTRRRSASSPPHANHSRSAWRQAPRESCGRSQGESAAFRFRSRQSARLQVESRTASRRGTAIFSHRANSACISDNDERGAAFAGIEFIRKPHRKHTDDQHHPSRARCFSRQHALFASCRQSDNRSARAERLARQHANRKPARAGRNRTRSARRAARLGQLPCPVNANRRRGCAAGFRAAARSVVHTQADAARACRSGASAVAGQPRSQQLGKLRRRRLARQARASAAHRFRRRLTRKNWRWHACAPGCATASQHPRLSERRFPRQRQRPLRSICSSNRRFAPRLRRRRTASARLGRRQSPLWQRTRQQGNWSRRSARPGFFRSSTK